MIGFASLSHMILAEITQSLPKLKTIFVSVLNVIWASSMVAEITLSHSQKFGSLVGRKKRP